jgi:hypothetical protein
MMFADRANSISRALTNYAKSIPKIVLNPMILLQHAIQTLIQSVVKSLSFYYFYYDVK